MIQKYFTISLLIHHLASSLDKLSDQVLQERLGVGFSQVRILVALKQNNKISQKSLADSLSQTEASISRQLSLLQSMGLVVIKINPKSRRQRSVAITFKGENLLDECIAVLERYQTPLYEAVSQRQLQKMSSLLEQLHEGCCDHLTSCLLKNKNITD